MKEKTIFLLGTFHSFKKYKEKVRKVTKENNFSGFFSEGVDSKKLITKNNLTKEPFLILPIYSFLKILQSSGTEFDELQKISLKRKISIYGLDENIKSILDRFHKQYNYFIYAFIFFLMLIIVDIGQSIINLVFSFVFSSILYFGYFIIITSKIRERIWIKRIVRISKYKRKGNFLLVAGKFHINRVKKELIKRGFSVEVA